MVHNGGLSQRARAHETAYAVGELMMQTNYLGPVALTKALLPHMMSRRRGHFVVVTSVLARVGMPNRTSLCSKRARGRTSDRPADSDSHDDGSAYNARS